MAPTEALDEMMKNTSKEQMKEWDKSWKKWMDEHQSSFVDIGSPLGKNKRVSKDGIKDVRNELTGYSVVEADSHQEAAEIFKNNPQLEMDGSYIEITEWVEMDGMTDD